MSEEESRRSGPKGMSADRKPCLPVGNGSQLTALVALWSLRGPTTTNDDRKGPKTKGEVKGPFLLFVQVIGGLFRGLIIRRSLVRVSQLH